MKYLWSLLSIVFFTTACTNKQQEAIKGIEATEIAFNLMVAEKGVAAGFSFYAAEDAVKYLGDTLIFGKQNITNFYKNQPKQHIQLQWKADFVDASVSGDLGYSYGKYSFKLTDSLGNEHQSAGIFHTIWKKQKDGTWKFVWD